VTVELSASDVRDALSLEAGIGPGGPTSRARGRAVR
jgi:hypothetical protein